MARGRADDKELQELRWEAISTRDSTQGKARDRGLDGVRTEHGIKGGEWGFQCGGQGLAISSQGTEQALLSHRVRCKGQVEEATRDGAIEAISSSV
jgi:hypothetical protein